MTTGKYSGRQPAMTALMAIFSIVAGAHLGGIGPMTSCGSRFVPPSIFSTRSGVGGTIGNPSLNFSRQNQSLAASQLSSTSMIGEVRFIRKINSRKSISDDLNQDTSFAPSASFPLAGKD